MNDPETAEPTTTITPIATVACSLRLGNRRGPVRPDGMRGEVVAQGEMPVKGVDWLRKWKIDLSAAAKYDAAWLYAGGELIFATSARNAELTAVAEETAHQQDRELTELGQRVAERRGELQGLERQVAGQQDVLRQTQAEIESAQRELREIRSHVASERVRTSEELKVISELFTRERSHLQGAAEQERDRTNRERDALHSHLQAERDRVQAERTQLHTERSDLRKAHEDELAAERTAHRERLTSIRAEGEDMINKTRAALDTERVALADRLADVRTDYERQLKDLRDNYERQTKETRTDHERQTKELRDSFELERKRINDERDKAIADARANTQANLAAMSGLEKQVRDMVGDAIQAGRDQRKEFEAMGTALAVTTKNVFETVKNNLDEDNKGGPKHDVVGELGVAFAKILGRVDPNKVLKLSPKFAKMLGD